MPVIEYARRRCWKTGRHAYRAVLFVGTVVCFGFAALIETDYTFFSYYYRSNRPALRVAAGVSRALATGFLLEAIFLVLRRRSERDDG